MAALYIMPSKEDIEKAEQLADRYSELLRNNSGNSAISLLILYDGAADSDCIKL